MIVDRPEHREALMKAMVETTWPKGTFAFVTELKQSIREATVASEEEEKPVKGGKKATKNNKVRQMRPKRKK